MTMVIDLWLIDDYLFHRKKYEYSKIFLSKYDLVWLD